MTRMTAITLTALIMLFTSAMAVSAVDDENVIRGPVATVVDATYTWGPQEFAGFFYDIDDNLGTEQITMTITGDALAEDVPAGQDRGVIYRTTGQADDFEFEDWGEYITIGFLADQYFAAYVEADNAKEDAFLYYDSEDRNLMVDEQLSRVLINDDEEYTFTTGTPLKLKEGYELAIRAIDLDGNKVYVELFKDGKSVDSAVVEPSKDNADMEDKSYTYTMNMGDTEDIVVIAAHFKNAFRGAEQDLATVDGIWQISDAVTEVEEDTEYDKMTVQTVNSDDYVIEMDNEDNKITLNKNKDTLLMENIRIKTADQDDITAEDPLRFYIYKELVEPGTYEIRGSFATVVDGAQQTWDVSNFAGFFYDIDDNLGNEQISLTITGDALAEDVPAGQDRGVIYRTTGQADDFEFEDWGEYITIGFLADQYFAAYVEADNAKEDAFLYYDSEDRNLMVDEQLSRVLINDDEEYTFTTGTPLKLKEGYELAIRAIDLDGNKVYVELFKDGKSVDSAVVEPSKDNADMEDKSYTYTMNMGDTEDIVVIAAHFKNAFRGAEQDLATVDGIWQISDAVTEVEEDTEYDKMTVQTVNSDDYVIEMDNEDNKITLNKNKDTLLMENIRIKTADQDDITAEDPLRFYIYEELVIEGEEEVVVAPAEEEVVEVVEPEVVEEEVVEETPVEEEVVVEEAPAEEEVVEEAPVEIEKAPAEDEGGIPGFEMVFALTGLLAVSYLVLRRRD